MLTSSKTDDDAGWPTTGGGIQYSLPKASIKVKLSEKNEVLRVTMEQPTLGADPEHTYLLRYKTSPFASDKFDIEVDSNTGLLKKIDMTADDKTGDIIVEIAKAVVAESSETDGETVLDERIVDPTNKSELDTVSKAFNAIGLEKTGKNPEIVLFSKNPTVANSPKADCSIGVCYRQTMPYIVGFSFGKTIHYETQVNLPNNAPAIPISLDRTLFVSRKNTLEFENGILKKGSLEKPSEGLEVAKLPITVMKGILSAPAEIFNQQKALNEAQGSLIDSEKTLQEKLAAKTKESSENDKSLPLLTGTSQGRINIKQSPIPNGVQNPINGGTGIPGQIDPGSLGTLPPNGGR